MNKRYLPIDLKIQQFSALPNTNFGLILSKNRLYFLDLKSGNKAEIKIKELEDVTNIKCINETTCIIATFDALLILELEELHIKSYSNYFGAVKALAADIELNTIAVANYDKVFLIQNGKINTIETSFSKGCWAIAVTNDGQQIAISNQDQITLLKANTQEIIQSFKPDTLPISCAFSPNNKTLLYGDDWKNIKTIDLASNNIITYENPYFSKPTNIFWLNDKQFLIVFLSKAVGIYTVNQSSPTKVLTLDDFPSRYFQYAQLLTPNRLAIAVEDLRNKAYAKEGVPNSDVVVLMEI